jgi:hypothetical protein
VTVDKDFSDIQKDFVSVLKDYSKKFYETKISKYKNNSNLGNSDSNYFIEYYTRNMIKISYFYILVNSSDRALKYFEKAYENCFKLLQFYSKKAQKFISIPTKAPETVSRSDVGLTLLEEVKNPQNAPFIFHFYDFQKCDEVVRLSNLLKMQMVFLKFKKNQIFNYEIVRELVSHMNRVKGYTIWETTFMRKFDIKNLIHLFYLAFSFGRREFRIDIKTNMLILFDLFKNLISLSNKFLDFHFLRNNQIISNLKNSVGWSHFSRFSLECDSLKIKLKEVPFKDCVKIIQENKSLLGEDYIIPEISEIEPNLRNLKSDMEENDSRGPSELHYYNKQKNQKFYGLDINDEIKLETNSDIIESNTTILERYILKENDLNYFIWLYDYLNDFTINQLMLFKGLENSKRVAKYYLVLLFENIIRNGKPVFHDIFKNPDRFASGLGLASNNWSSFNFKITDMFKTNAIEPESDENIEKNLEESEIDDSAKYTKKIKNKSPITVSGSKKFTINSLAKTLLISHSTSVLSLSLSNTPKFLLLRELYDCFKLKYLKNNLKKQWEMLWRFMSYVPDYLRIQQNKKFNCRYSDLMHSNMESLLSNVNDVRELKQKGRLESENLKEILSEDKIKFKILSNIANGINGNISSGWVPDHELVFDTEIFYCLKQRREQMENNQNNQPQVIDIKVFKEEVIIESCFESPLYGKYDEIKVELKLKFKNYFAFKLFDEIKIEFNDSFYDFSVSKNDMKMEIIEISEKQGSEYFLIIFKISHN